jgi:chaperonin GroEL
MMLTTEAIITEIPEPKAPMPAGAPGGIGGLGAMH